MAKRLAYNMLDVQTWPSGNHMAVFMLAAVSAPERPSQIDPAHPGMQGFRIQASQLQIAIQIGVSRRTVGRCFDDFAAMGLMRSTHNGRRWYMHKKSGNADSLEDAIADRWPAVSKSREREQPPVNADDDMSWYFDPAADVETAPAPAQPPRQRSPQLLEILTPTTPPGSEIRLRTAMADVLRSMEGVDPPAWMAKREADGWTVAGALAVLRAQPGILTVREYVEHLTDYSAARD